MSKSSEQISLDRAIERVLARSRELRGVIGVMLAGSAARGDMDANSDFDFLVLIGDGVPWPLPFRDGGRETYIDETGRQVEIGFGTVARHRAKMAEAAANGIPFRAQQLVEGRVLYTNGDLLRHLVEEARVLLSGGPPPLERQDLLWECYETWNHLKDVEDVVSDAVTSRVLAGPAFEQMLRLFFRLERHWLPRPKAMMREVQQADPLLFGLCATFAASATPENAFAALSAIKEHLASRFNLTFEAAYTSAR